MKNEEWEVLKAKYEKEEQRRWDIQRAIDEATRLKNEFEDFCKRCNNYDKIEIYVPGSDWRYNEKLITLGHNQEIINLFKKCLNTFIVSLDTIINKNIEEE